MNGLRILFLLALVALLCAGGRIRSGAHSAPLPGNIADGMYTIVGEASHRCLEIPNSSCALATALQIFDCDKTEAGNNQKFNVISDAAGNYTISPAHSDLCLEVSAEQTGDRIPVVQSECAAGKVSQKWSMSQYGVNLEIRDVGSNRCLDIMRKGTGNFAPIFLQACNDGPNQRWRLNKTTINVDQGVICRASSTHPAYDCSGTNDQQRQTALGKTLTKARCDEACRVNKMVGCHWEGMK
jgi:ricin-type beta-trefoil lectin protein